jgi:hypothetical protein
MSASDKFTGNPQPAARPRQRRSVFVKNMADNKSAPRMRKEKRQTRRSRCDKRGPQRRSSSMLDVFHRRFAPFLRPNPNGQSASRLTFLTPASQNCQTHLLFSDSPKATPRIRHRCYETCWHHNNIRPWLPLTSITLGLLKVTWCYEATGNENSLEGQLSIQPGAADRTMSFSGSCQGCEAEVELGHVL